MHRCWFVLLTLVVVPPVGAQVRGFQTISATEGGFEGPLVDGDRFGVSAAAPGDLDGDGVPDLVVGAYGDSDARGAVWVLLLRPNGTVRQSNAVRPEGLSPLDLFGTSVAALGDLDGDGRPEIAVGADRADDGGPDRGAVYVVSLGADGTARVLQTISSTQGGLTDGPADGDLFGHSVAGIGDLRRRRHARPRGRRRRRERRRAKARRSLGPPPESRRQRPRHPAHQRHRRRLRGRPRRRRPVRPGRRRDRRPRRRWDARPRRLRHARRRRRPRHRRRVGPVPPPRRGRPRTPEGERRCRRLRRRTGDGTTCSEARS